MRSDVSTIMGTAQASGIALVAAARRGLPVALHTPSEVKAAVSGSGRAGKAQVVFLLYCRGAGEEPCASVAKITAKVTHARQ